MESNGTSSNTTITTIAPTELYMEEELARVKAALANQTIITKVGGLLSAIGSAYIIYSMVFHVRDSAHRQKKLHRTFDRLLLGISVADFVSSIAYFVASW